MATSEVSPASETLLSHAVPTGEEMVEWDRRTVKRLKAFGWWLVVLFALAAFIMSIIALAKISGTPDAVASYVASVSNELLVPIEGTFTNLTVRIMTLEAHVAALQSCACFSAPPSTDMKRIQDASMLIQFGQKIEKKK